MSTRVYHAYFAVSLTEANRADGTGISEEEEQADAMWETWWELCDEGGCRRRTGLYTRASNGYRMLPPGTANEQKELQTWITIWHEILFLELSTERYLYLLLTTGVNTSLLLSREHTRHLEQLAGLAF